MGRSLASILLIGLGIVLIVAAGGIVGYARYAQWQYTSRAAPGPREVLPAQVVAAPKPRTPATPVSPLTSSGRNVPPMGSRDWVLAVPTSTPRTTTRRVLVPTVPRSTPAAAPTPEPEPAPPTLTDAGPPIRLTIPKIGVSAPVQQVGVEDGEYVVPLWEVGHHGDSPNPGAPGNAVMNGHLETISAGHVFAQLKDLAVGDAVYTDTDAERLTWAVRETTTVPNTDHAFLGPTPDRRLTLYTCTGTFNPIARDYSHRLVVVAELARVDPLTP